MDDATTLSAEDVVRGFLDDLSRRWRCGTRSDIGVASRDLVDELKPPSRSPSSIGSCFSIENTRGSNGRGSR
jgi:hypothetical protein